jgi:hypothetical protein
LDGGAGDSDGDGLPDTYEEQFAFLDPNNAADGSADEDGDTISNSDEFKNGTAPDKKDTDGDGLDDNVETGTGTFVDAGNTGTKATNPDTDDDGLNDGVETMRDKHKHFFRFPGRLKVGKHKAARSFSPVIMSSESCGLKGLQRRPEGHGSVLADFRPGALS